jgi:putative membrane protein
MTKLTQPRLWLCSVPALFLSTALIAQVPGGGAPQQPSMPSQQQPSTSTMPSNEGNAPAGQNFADSAFLSKAMEGSDAEVELGKLAQQKSQSQDVKQFAQRMVNDHSQMNDKWFKPVAKQLNVSEPKGPSKKDKKLIEKLQSLNGQRFDTEYIQAMVKDHKDDLKEFQGEAQAAQDPNVKQIATQGSNIIEKHLQMIEQIAQAHNVPVEGKEISSR